MIGHDYISHQQKFVALTNLSECLHEEISCPHRAEQRQTTTATEGDEVQISSSVLPFQSYRHDQNPHA